MAESWRELQEALDEIFEAMRRAWSDDVLDSFGNVIETAEHRYWRIELAERQLEKVLEMAGARADETERASLRGQKQALHIEMDRTVDGEQYDSLQNAESSIEGANDELGTDPVVSL